MSNTADDPSNTKGCSDEKKIAGSNEENSARTIEFEDVMRSKPKFLIFSLLSMYPSLTLRDLSRITGKSKSTLSVHLSDLDSIGLINVKEEETAGRINVKHFSLVPKFWEKIADKKCKQNEDKLTKYRNFIQVNHAFAQTQLSMLKQWEKYLDQLEKNLKPESLKLLESELDPILNEKYRKISVVSFYTPDVAKKFVEKLLDIYHEAEKENEARDEEEERVHPNFIGVQVLPIKRAFDYFLDYEED